MDPTSSSSSRSTPLLRAQPSDLPLDHIDLLRMKSRQLPSEASHTSQAALTRPRPEIILRWKRFAALVLLGAFLISAFTVTLYIGIPLKEVPTKDAESKVALYNSYSGVVMGFAESSVSQLLSYLFPVFIVYLHNLKWSSRDDPATREISKAKKISLMLFFPIVMVAIGNSLSAVQTNQSGGDDAAEDGGSRRLLEELAWSDTTSSSGLDDTVFQTVGRESGLTQRTADLDFQRVVTGTRVVVGFPLHDWRHEVTPTYSQDETVRVTRGDRVNVRRSVVSLETSVDLVRHGLATWKTMVPMSTSLTPLDALSASATPSDLLGAVADVLQNSAFNTSTMALTLSHQQLQPHMELASLTLELPFAPTTEASIACGAEACVSLSSDELVRLRPVITASQFLPHCRNGEFESCTAESNAAFIFSSTVSSTATDGKVSYTQTLTFSRLAWAFDNSLELCTAMEHQSCKGLSLELAQSHRHLILPASLVPSTLRVPSQPLSLVQIVQPPVVTKINELAALTVLNGKPSTTTDNREAVDQVVSYLREHRLTGDVETMTTTLRATALLFLFQNALVAPLASSPTIAWQRHLATVSTGKDYQIFVANTHFGAISTWTACGILLLLSMLVLVMPNARARLEPPKGGNARAERFVSVQTEEVYPNLIYKKRFRIGKTGEKIKFREFAVESVTLHHKMEEDEQIEL